MTDFYNLLQDSLKNGYKSVIQIYNKIESSIREKNQ